MIRLGQFQHAYDMTEHVLTAYANSGKCNKPSIRGALDIQAYMAAAGINPERFERNVRAANNSRAISPPVAIELQRPRGPAVSANRLRQQPLALWVNTPGIGMFSDTFISAASSRA
jgi:hypothetical protein